MKKLLIGVVLAIGLAGCIKTDNDLHINDKWTYHGNTSYTKVVEIEGHTYIIYSRYNAGNVIHAASCKCMCK